MPAKRPGSRTAAAAKPKAVPADWFEQEPRPSTTIAKLGKRLFRRGRASWGLWALIALVGAAGWTLFKLKRPGQFEVTVVLRVSEGQVSDPGTGLGRRTVRAFVNDLAFTSPRLIAVMAKHPRAFPRVESDPVFAVQSFRENMTVEIADNDFVEDRRPGDPPRSVRLVITLKGSDPELTWEIAQELSTLVAGSTMAGQRAALESELQGATAEAHNAADALSEVEEKTTVVGVPNPQLESARRRLLAAQQRVQDATIGLRALGEQHVLKFEVVDPGRVPPRPNRVQVAIQTFVVTLLVALLAGWLLSGAFDPRVLDEADVADLGMPLLGRLPREAPGPSRGTAGSEPPEDAPGASEASDPRV
jgi:hypothetical protein